MKADEKTVELYQLAKKVAHKGKHVLYGNVFRGVFDEREYQVQYTMSANHDFISISGPKFGVSLTLDRTDDGDDYRSYTWRGQAPENLQEILSKLEPADKDY